MDFLQFMHDTLKNAEKSATKQDKIKIPEANKKLKKVKKYTADEFLNLQANEFQEIDTERLNKTQEKKYQEFCTRQSMRQKLIDTTPDEYKLINTVAQLQKVMGYIKQHKPVIACDTETTGLDTFDDKIVGMSFGFKKQDVLYNFYVPIRHTAGNIPYEEAMAIIKDVMEDANIPKVFHNAAFDIPMYMTEDITVQGLYMDTLIAFKCLREDLMSYSLKELAKTYLKLEDAIPYEILFGRNASYADVDVKYYAYPCRDTEMTYKLYELVEKHLNKEGFEQVKHVYFDIEHPLIQTVCEMKMAGMLLDEDRFKEVRHTLATNVANLQKQLDIEIERILANSEIHQAAVLDDTNQFHRTAKQISMEGFNFNSAVQKAYLFYAILGCQVKADGKKTTDKNFLEDVKSKFHIAELFSKYSAEAKLFSAFTDNLKEKQSSDGKIRPSFQQFGTKTGRFSCNTPNFQQLPAKRDEIRAMFKAPDGFLLLGADYSQIELRILAHFSQDPNLLHAYKTGRDIHTQTACLVFGHDYEEANRLNKEMDAGHIDEKHPDYLKAKEIVKHRKYSKVINFGLIYGMSSKGLSETLGVSREEAEEFTKKYFEGLPTVQTFMDSQKQKAYRLGYVETLDGRRRRLNKELFGADKGKKASAERQSANFVIQGTAADLLKKAMPQVQAYLKTLNPEASIVAQIHDELIMQVPDNITQTQIKDITNIMCSAMEFDVPLDSDPELMKYWTEKIPFEEIPN